MISPSKTGKSFHRTNQELREDIVKSTSMQVDKPQVQDAKETLPLQPTGSKKSLYEDNRSLSTERNMKFHVDQLEEKLEELLVSVRDAREQFRQLLDQTTLIKNNLVYEDLYSIKTEMDGKIQGLFHQIRQGTDTSRSRFNEVRNECGVLWESTQQVRENVFQLSMRVEKLELKMGYKDMYRLENM